MELIVEIEKSFPLLEKLFTYDTLFEFVQTPDSRLCLYHFGLGTWIRNNLLMEQCLLYQLFVENGICIKDDMSSLIIQRFHRYLKNGIASG